ncbi:uncharacterized protein LOC121878935 isoform X1 [Homarus americanus]|uniref:uncharacterized protein LOC121878935 isoform X1 n=1 Tax=Homarus americanus TaxID=6706 RepID=UPI001C47EB12|nr:uncharacterized protein LOC121878935 isoform X1 [Homarus americanus]
MLGESDFGGEFSGDASVTGDGTGDVLKNVGGGGAPRGAGRRGQERTPQGPIEKKGRMRERRVDEWAQEVAKRKRNLGEEYVSYSTKKVVKARQVGPPCPDGCFDKLGRDMINTIFTNFWAIGDYNTQNGYLHSLIRKVPVKRRRVEAEVSRRPFNYHFFVKLRQREFKVCRQGFTSIHGVGKKKMEVLMHKLKESPSGTPILDKRGHHPSSKAIRGSRLQHVHEHIRALPVLACHYSRAHSPHRRYLEVGGSIAELHSSYLVWMSEQYPGEETVSKRFYHTLFKKDYNIEFGAPFVRDDKTKELNKNNSIKGNVNELHEKLEKEENSEGEEIKPDIKYEEFDPETVYVEDDTGLVSLLDLDSLQQQQQQQSPQQHSPPNDHLTNDNGGGEGIIKQCPDLTEPVPTTSSSVPYSRGDQVNEFHLFGMNVASQLRAMPLRAALEVQLQIQRILTQKRLEIQ